MATLPDANTNPWYVLMTLYGEQEGKRVDNALHAKNRAVWKKGTEASSLKVLILGVCRAICRNSTLETS